MFNFLGDFIMDGNLYALLVGIDKYQSVRHLSGCVNDITSFKQFLDTRINDQFYQLQCSELINENATREKIIQEFQGHLCKAGKGDTVLFYYCGHGAREKAGAEFQGWELDNAHETIVCYDSRSKTTDGKQIPDLADKELRYLISQVANKGENSPDHILIVFDCCHSSSGTRGEYESEGIRQLDDAAPARNYEDFCFAQDIPKTGLSPEIFPQGDHTFMAACLNTETAKEIRISSETAQSRGLFSYALLKELDDANQANLSYQNLIQEVRTRVNGIRLYQNPELEINQGLDPQNSAQIHSKEAKAEKLAFLGNPAIIKPRDPVFTLQYRPAVGATSTDPAQNEEWIINSGAFMGIKKDMELAVYSEESEYKDCEITNEKGEIVKEGTQKAIAKVKITEVRASESVTTFLSETLPKNSNILYPSIVVKRPIPTVLFYFEGKDSAEQEILNKVKDKLQDSLIVGFVESKEQAHQYRLYIHNQHFEIRDGVDNRLLVEPFAAQNNDASINLAVERIEHLAKWLTTRDLENPRSSIDKNKVEIEVIHQEKVIQEPHLTLYQEIGKKAEIQIKIKNNSGKHLFFSLLGISSDYSIEITPFLYDGVNKVDWLEIEDQTIYTAKLKMKNGLKENIPISFPQGENYDHLTEYEGIFKLIASNSQFDVKPFLLPELILPKTRAGIWGEEEETPPIGDWVTKQFKVTIIRPKSSVTLNSPTSTELAQGLSIKVPEGFSTKVSVKTPSTASEQRSLDNTLINLPSFQDTQPFDLIDRRGSDRSVSQLPNQQVSVLELSNTSNIERVTPETPIIINSDSVLSPEEGIMAIAHDGEFWLPVGYGETVVEEVEAEMGERQLVKEKTQIKIEHLIETTTGSDRKITEAISLFFVKVVLRKQQTSWLRQATIDIEEKVSFSAKGDLASVKKAVEKAERVVLFIHGILGDTESMIPSIKMTGLLNENGSQDSQKYDLILSFDYENLNTTIQDTAHLLKQQLEQVGLGTEHGKTLHIIAHSMGGLVSRTFIELQGGNEIVNHLMMFGTPNGGSEWSSVYQFATLLLSVGLNFIPTSFLAGSIISLLSDRTNDEISQTLQQMNIKSSDLIPALERSPDPHCPYTIIAGDTQLDRELEDKAKNLLEALKRKVWKNLEFPFKGQRNDIAVAVERIFTQNVLENRNPAVNFVPPIPCNHLVYFQDTQGLEALTQAVQNALP